MNLSSFSFTVTDFSKIDPEIHSGITGFAEWRILYRDNIRIRLVVYSKDYLADHWCNKGHIIFCHEGEMETELKDGRKYSLTKGQIYTVGDNAEAHRSYSKKGCTLFIVD